MAPVFQPLARHPDHVGLEREVLAWWDGERVFDRLREQTRGGPRWHFLDGPITANNPMGAHHAWGRTLKDVFVRYKALRGFDQRYQNGFDCQGLWVEVEVEKALGLNSKRDIEEYGLAEFAARCRERVAHYAEVITEQDRRLGRWMDWDDDYYTFSDTNIEYIWRFLAEVHRRGWLYKGHRSTEWCPRCGTSISQHELFAGEYVELEHPSLHVRFPLRGRDGEALRVWTTTPWTLPANVAAAVHPDAEYGRLADGDWVAVERYPDGEFAERVRGEQLVGLAYDGPFDGLRAQEGVEHLVIPWDDVSLEEGTGIVHIAPGAGSEDFELSRVHGLAVLTPIDESGRFLPGYGALEGLSTDEAADPIVDELRRRELLVEAGTIVHRYPLCWRCGTPLVFRVVDDWFVSAEEIREPMLAANATVEWTPSFYAKRMDDWLRNMGDWNISRKRYFGLPLPFYPCDCGHLDVIGSRAELEERATAGLDGLLELHRPWIDGVTIRCRACGEDVRRITEVGDAWLDAGIVAFSTLGWQNERWIEGGYGNGAARGLTGADLPDHAYWEQWFPADWVSEMREQIRLWFYSLSFMSVTLTGRSPYRAVLTYEKLRDETGREMHRSWGNAIEANEALERMGADVMRWMFSEQVPSQNLRFGYGPAGEIKRRLLTLWNSAKFLVDYGNVEGFRPRYGDLARGPEADALQGLDRWLLARTQRLVEEATAEYERFWTPGITRAFEAFVDDLSNWYIRRSRRRFWESDETALRTLWYALVQGLRVIGPVMPFLAEHLWRNLVAEPCVDAPDSVFLAGWPQPVPELADAALLEEIAAVRRVVELGRQARATRNVKLRQPLRTAVVYGGERARAHADEIASELRVKEVRFESGEAARERLKPELRKLGPRLGAKLPAVRRALEEGRWEARGDEVLVEGETLAPGEVLREHEPVHEGWAVAAEGDVSVEIDPELDDELVLEGRVLDLIRRLNDLRKEAGLELTDRIVVRLPREHAELVERHADWIKAEVLAVELELDGAAGEPQIAKA
ncbi:MAG: isoleucine--tRNA ligase [Thermoleophilia bacterium]|nr:isoleucine--tRNA ligase [Thermoleophilia bacterium]